MLAENDQFPIPERSTARRATPIEADALRNTSHGIAQLRPSYGAAVRLSSHLACTTATAMPTSPSKDRGRSAGVASDRSCTINRTSLRPSPDLDTTAEQNTRPTPTISQVQVGSTLAPTAVTRASTKPRTSPPAPPSDVEKHDARRDSASSGTSKPDTCLHGVRTMPAGRGTASTRCAKSLRSPIDDCVSHAAILTAKAAAAKTEVTTRQDSLAILTPAFGPVSVSVSADAASSAASSAAARLTPGHRTTFPLP